MKKLFQSEPVDQITLFDLMQNDVLGAIAFQSFTLGFYNVAKHKENTSEYPKLEYFFYVLPIVYNHASLSSFLSSLELYTALSRDPSIILGLQERANKMVFQTFDGLNLAFSKKILSIDTSGNTIRLLKPFSSKKLTLPLGSYSLHDSVKSIQDCSYRVGNIFAKRHDKNLQSELNIAF
jgi:hypothetical protein